MSTTPATIAARVARAARILEDDDGIAAEEKVTARIIAQLGDSLHLLAPSVAEQLDADPIGWLILALGFGLGQRVAGAMMQLIVDTPENLRAIMPYMLTFTNELLGRSDADYYRGAVQMTAAYLAAAGRGDSREVWADVLRRRYPWPQEGDGADGGAQ
ncbi:hypothetical protein SLS56_008817 [Neofusicoccum ribis]|uniref:Uncharacterized protein n=1 Tax=Neofusicoccum ribis TaxID=45134 RepID=A0ABR3SJ40_9PEZI